MIRIAEKLKCELTAAADRIAVISVTVFLFALGGIILWVNGGSTYYYLKLPQGSAFTLAGAFVIWLCIYALYGFRLSMRWFGERCVTSKTLYCTAAVLLAYLLDLVWYAVYFCTRLTLFSQIILLISVILNISALSVCRRKVLLVKIADCAVICGQIYFFVSIVINSLLK